MKYAPDTLTQLVVQEHDLPLPVPRITLAADHGCWECRYAAWSWTRNYTRRDGNNGVCCYRVPVEMMPEALWRQLSVAAYDRLRDRVNTTHPDRLMRVRKGLGNTCPTFMVHNPGDPVLVRNSVSGVEAHPAKGS